MKENKYDNEIFFQKYSQMLRSQKGLQGAGEWSELEKFSRISVEKPFWTWDAATAGTANTPLITRPHQCWVPTSLTGCSKRPRRSTPRLRSSTSARPAVSP